MGDTFDNETPPTRRDKPQTLSISPEETAAAEENSAENSAISSSSSSSAMHFARNRERERERERDRDHSSDGVSKRNNEFVGLVAPPRRESLNSCESQQQSQRAAVANSPAGFSSSLNKALGLNNRAMSSTTASSSSSSGRYSSSSIVVGGGVGNLPGTTTRKCVLTLDGYSYVIVASTPETLPSKREEGNIGSGGNSSIVGGGGGGGAGGAASGGNSGFGIAASGGGATSTATSAPNNGEQSPTGCDLGGNATINGQVAKHGSLTIVRRSNSRKNFTQIDSQTQSIASPSSANISFFQTPISESLAERLSAIGTNGSSAATDKRSGEYSTAIASTSTSLSSTATTTATTTSGKMQPSSPNQTNFATDTTQVARPTDRQTYDYRLSRDTIEYPNSITAAQAGSVLNPDFDHSSDHSVDTGSNLSTAGIWETDNLPPVDTPDALNKAAVRIRSLLRRMDHETVAYEDMQRNLHYAARVLEAVFIDESRSPTSGKSKLGQIASSSVESEDEAAKQRCNDGNCKNLNNNNSSNSSCSLHKSATEEQASANASDNQTSIVSRTKGVSLAPQTHSGPTGPPAEGETEMQSKTLETVTEEHTTATETEASTATTTATTTTATTTATDASSGSGDGAGQSVSSSSSCSNKATVQRQRRLRTPVWARSMSTNKTYLK